jgi:hypothetical protein
MWFCAKHDLWVRRNWPCVSCENEAKAVIKRKRNEEDDVERKGERGRRSERSGKTASSSNVKRSSVRASKVRSMKGSNVKDEGRR